MVVRLTHPDDFDLFADYLRGVGVRAVADEYGFVSLGLMEKPRSAAHERQELAGYVQTWNLINREREVVVVG
jgi:hypothetical protein